MNITIKNLIEETVKFLDDNKKFSGYVKHDIDHAKEEINFTFKGDDGEAYVYTAKYKHEDNHIVVKLYDKYYTITDDPVLMEKLNKVLDQDMIHDTKRFKDDSPAMTGPLLAIAIGHRHTKVKGYNLYKQKIVSSI